MLFTGADFVNMFGAKFYDKLMQKLKPAMVAEWSKSPCFKFK